MAPWNRADLEPGLRIVTRKPIGDQAQNSRVTLAQDGTSTGTDALQAAMQVL